MTNLTKKIATGVALSSTLVTLFSNVAFADTITVEGNGADTHQTVSLNTNNTTAVQQSNTATVVNNVTSNANSGGNTASKNTGGDVKVDAGGATSIANVSTAVNTNTAAVNCNCQTNGTTNVLVNGNGDGSYNKVDLDKTNTTKLGQTNNANVYNNVNTNANSGDNTANKNTGGDVKITSDDAVAVSNVSTQANKNFATIGGGVPAGMGAGNNVVISGNGSDSNNKIYLDMNKSIELDQTNTALVTNYVEANANSGYNTANKNTGGDVKIDAGGALAKTNVDNAVNFNFANIDCGCVTGGLDAKIKGNGDESKSKIDADINGALGVGQDNYTDVYNPVFAGATSGDNKANKNTGDVYNPFDPVSVSSDDAVTIQNVSTTGGVNSYGTPMPMNFPMFDLGHNVSMTFDWAHLIWGVSASN